MGEQPKCQYDTVHSVADRTCIPLYNTEARIAGSFDGAFPCTCNNAAGLRLLIARSSPARTSFEVRQISERGTCGSYIRLGRLLATRRAERPYDLLAGPVNWYGYLMASLISIHNIH